MKKGAPMLLGNHSSFHEHRKHARRRIVTMRDMNMTSDKGRRKNGSREERLPSDKGGTKHNKPRW